MLNFKREKNTKAAYQVSHAKTLISEKANANLGRAVCISTSRKRAQNLTPSQVLRLFRELMERRQKEKHSLVIT
jgi:hypothetical protein